MVEEERKKASSKDVGRKLKWKTSARVIELLGVLFWLVIFIKIAQTGYLTWIGITVGTLIIVPAFLSPIFGFAGMKRIEKVLSFFWGGMIALIILIAGIMLIWPESNNTWSPYQFDDELASIEAKRAIPDQDNAAIRYKSLFAAIDINDCPGSLLQKDGHIRNEFSEQPWKGSDYPEVSQWLDSHAETLDELLSISNMEKCRWAIEADIFDEYTVPYKPFRYCTQLIIIAGNRDLGEGRYKNAQEKSLCLLGMARQMYQQANKVAFMIGFDPERQAIRILKYILVNNHLPQEDIDRITNNLPTAENNWQKEITKLLKLEKIRFVNIMSAQYEINEKGRVRFSTESGTLFLDKYMWEHPKRTDRLRRLYRLINMPLDPNGLWDMAEVETAKFLHFLEQDSMPDTYTLLDGVPFELAGNSARWTTRAIYFDKLLYPILKKGYMSNIQLRRGTWLILGLRKYQDVHGTWPDELDMVSEYVPPEALIDITNGSKFVYIRDGEDFVFYSKGPNNNDEGGSYSGTADDLPIWPLKIKESPAGEQ